MCVCDHESGDVCMCVLYETGEHQQPTGTSLFLHVWGFLQCDSVTVCVVKEGLLGVISCTHQSWQHQRSWVTCHQRWCRGAGHLHWLTSPWSCLETEEEEGKGQRNWGREGGREESRIMFIEAQQAFWLLISTVLSLPSTIALSFYCMLLHASWDVCTIRDYSDLVYTSLLSPALAFYLSLYPFLSPKCALKCLTNSTPSTCFFQNFTWPSWLPVTTKSVLVCVHIVCTCACVEEIKVSQIPLYHVHLCMLVNPRPTPSFPSLAVQ